MSVERIVGRGTVECVEGDITAQETDAIVNAANNHLWMGSGVAGAIRRAGGQEIEAEAIALGPIEPGEAVVTGAGRLAARFVVHAAGMGQDLRTSADLVASSTRNSLLRAEEKELRSISFPSIGTGVGGFPLDECARLMIGEAAAFLRESRHVRLVRFVLWGGEAYSAFAEALHALQDEA